MILARTRFIFILIVAVYCDIARGHDLMSSYTIARLKSDSVELKIKIAADTAWPLVQDSVAPGAIFVREEFETAGRSILTSFAKSLEEVSADRKVLKPSDVAVEVAEDNFLFTLTYSRQKVGPILVKEKYLRAMSPGYVSHVTLIDQNERPIASKILSGTDFSFEIPAAQSGREISASNPPPPTFSAFLELGIEHILTGYDHLLFLGGLLVVCRRFSTMFGIITCFTLAHSLTLALAALNIFSLPSRLVEPLIAVTIVYVGIENLLRNEEPKGRWAPTFLFGLIHGFGFASVLKEIGLGAGGASILTPLFSFNLGVELGQISVTLVLLPVLWALRRWATGARFLTPAFSVVVALLGVYWFLQRTVLV